MLLKYFEWNWIEFTTDIYNSQYYLPKIEIKGRGLRAFVNLRKSGTEKNILRSYYTFFDKF